jgi:hypothetical protein
MVAALNLARDGFAVTVREREPHYGGSSLFDPSLHTTPLDVGATSEYLGVDLSGVFHPVSDLCLYLHDFEVKVPASMSYHVERGSRPTSIDTMLYEKCLEAGVEFQFNEPLRKEDIGGLPPGTIIACGLNRPAYDYLRVPCIDWFGWVSSGLEESEDCAWIWMDECITEYGYISFCNGLYYNLLFSAREVEPECLERYRDFMRRVRGMDYEDWEYIGGVIPLKEPDNPRLVREELIMCGTISGCMDPLMGFGISGALVSGKVAATAVAEPEKAQEEFASFTRNFASVLNFKNEVWYDLRAQVDALEAIARVLGSRRSRRLVIEALLKGRERSAIPGFGPLGCS